ncbi:MAG: 2-oxoacid:acceptor oxidoreductase family protein [Lachnospiraceae bacterium]|nr:2-oxoacid:acceptor oxidoreductase family protein [Lachnospiraceae bacterium]
MVKIKFYGIGGQGAVTAAKVLSKAVSLYQDEYAVTVPAYGHERRGAPVFAHVIVDDSPVLLNCYVYEPDIVLVMDESILDKNVNVGEGCTEETILVLNSGNEKMIERYRNTYGFKRIYVCDGTAIAERNIGRSIPNSSMLGALAKTELVTIEAVENAIRDSFGKVGELNVRAARDAYEHTENA